GGGLGGPAQARQLEPAGHAHRPDPPGVRQAHDDRRAARRAGGGEGGSGAAGEAARAGGGGEPERDQAPAGELVVFEGHPSVEVFGVAGTNTARRVAVRCGAARRQGTASAPMTSRHQAASASLAAIRSRRRAASWTCWAEPIATTGPVNAKRPSASATTAPGASRRVRSCSTTWTRPTVRGRPGSPS